MPDSVNTGYEVSFGITSTSRRPIRSMEEIRADIVTLEKETEGLLTEIIGGHAG